MKPFALQRERSSGFTYWMKSTDDSPLLVWRAIDPFVGCTRQFFLRCYGVFECTKNQSWWEATLQGISPSPLVVNTGLVCPSFGRQVNEVGGCVCVCLHMLLRHLQDEELSVFSVCEMEREREYYSACSQRCPLAVKDFKVSDPTVGNGSAQPFPDHPAELRLYY